MQKRKMHRIDIAFIALKIVTSVKDFGGCSVFGRYCEKLIIGQQRRLARTHIGKNDPAQFLTGIGWMVDFLPVRSASRLARLLEHPAAHVVEPAVIQASEPAVFDPAIAQIGAAVRAMEPDQAEPCLIVTEQHQFFAKYLNLQRGTSLRQFLAQRDGLPVAAQKLAARCIRADFSEQSILFRANHGLLPRKTIALQKYSRCRTKSIPAVIPGLFHLPRS